MLSLSTAWFGNSQTSTREVLAEVRRLGFRSIEWGIAGVQLDEAEVAAAVRAGEMAVSSVHTLADFPIADDVDRRGGHLGSTDPVKRQQTIDGVCYTIERARRLGARAVALHAGGITESPVREKFMELVSRWNESGPSPDYERGLREVHETRRREAPAYFERVVESLGAVVRRVGEFPLGIECRYYYFELPLPEELEAMWAALGSRCFGYWHDVGHARMLEIFGGIPEMSWLDRYGARLVGVHLHDMIGASDHRAPGTGELDLPGIARRIVNRDCVRVVELNPRTKREDVIAGREYLESLGL